MDKFKKVKVIGNVIGFNMYTFGEKETYNVQFPDMTIAELESYQFEDADAYHTNGKPLCLRNILARLRGLPEHDREVWLKGIMDEFELDFSHAKWREGYEQGKFDGAVEAGKSNKVVIPQFVAEWINYCKFTHVDLQHALVVGDVYFYNYANQKDFSKLKEFLETEDNQKLFVRVGWGYLFTTGPNAGSDKIPLNSDYYKKLSGNLDVDDLKTLLIKALVNGYEVEKEKLYTAKLKLITISYVNYINKRSDGAIILSDLNTASGVYQTSFTQSELEELDIWDNPVFEIEEVK